MEWIGYFFVAWGIGEVIWHVRGPGPYRYIREGIPVAARVLGTDTIVQGAGNVQTFRAL